MYIIMVGVAEATVLVFLRLSFLLKIAYIPFKKQELNIHDNVYAPAIRIIVEGH